VRLVVLGSDERLVDLPEFAAARDMPGFDAVRYFDYTPELKLVVIPEEDSRAARENGPPGKSLLVGAFARALYRVTALRPVDPDFDKRLEKQQYELRVKRLDIEFDRRLEILLAEATAASLWRGTPAARDRVDYWAAGVEAYFDAAGTGFAPIGADRPITTREALKAYDPSLFTLVDETMAFRERADWRYGAR